jgi:hypothetical protein
MYARHRSNTHERACVQVHFHTVLLNVHRKFNGTMVNKTKTSANTKTNFNLRKEISNKPIPELLRDIRFKMPALSPSTKNIPENGQFEVSGQISI